MIGIKANNWVYKFLCIPQEALMVIIYLFPASSLRSLENLEPFFLCKGDLKAG